MCFFQRLSCLLTILLLGYLSAPEQLKEVAEKEVVLVPMRLDIDYDGKKLRDTFTWNLNGNVKVLASYVFCFSM
jgi:hypothetical protein